MARSCQEIIKQLSICVLNRPSHAPRPSLFLTSQGRKAAVRSCRAVPMFLFMALITIAMISARDYAGGLNDGSRLATVESLVDYQTFRIDRSIFAEVPAGL